VDIVGIVIRNKNGLTMVVQVMVVVIETMEVHVAMTLL